MNLDNREKWLEKVLKKIPKGSKILDAGAGELQYKKFCNHLKYTSQDFAQYDGKGDKKGFQIGEWDNSKLDIVSDITKIPVKDKSFDAVMCIEVFEHLPYPHLAVKEFSRILKKGGELILTAPFCSLTHFAPYHFCTGFNRYWYEKVLEDNGFEILQMKYNGNYFDYLIQELKRIPAMDEKYSKGNFAKGFIFKTSQRIIIRYLRRMSQNDRNSNEVLSFGLHILAKKK